METTSNVDLSRTFPMNFLREAFDYEPMAAIRLIGAWGGNDPKVTTEMANAAFGFMLEIDPHPLLVRCRCCTWPVVDGEEHEWCNSDNCAVCGETTTSCTNCGEENDVRDIDSDGHCRDCQPCPGCGDIDPRSNCICSDEDDAPTMGEVRSRAFAAGFRGEALNEVASQFPGDFI